MAEWNSRMATARTLWQSGRQEAAFDECDRAYKIYSGDMDFGYKRLVLRLKGFVLLASRRIDD